MKVKCLSIRNPQSWLVVAGVKDVENRSWTTKYRGTLFIQSSGNYEQKDIGRDDLPYAIRKEFEEKIVYNKDGLITAKRGCRYKNYLRSLCELDIKSLRFNEGSFFRSQCICGKVDLVDIVKHSRSPFSEKNCYHWIMKNAVMFENPVLYVKGKLRFFDYEIRDEVFKYS